MTEPFRIDATGTRPASRSGSGRRTGGPDSWESVIRCEAPALESDRTTWQKRWPWLRAQSAFAGDST